MNLLLGGTVRRKKNGKHTRMFIAFEARAIERTNTRYPCQLTSSSTVGPCDEINAVSAASTDIFIPRHNFSRIQKEPPSSAPTSSRLSLCLMMPKEVGIFRATYLGTPSHSILMDQFHNWYFLRSLGSPYYYNPLSSSRGSYYVVVGFPLIK